MLTSSSDKVIGATDIKHPRKGVANCVDTDHLGSLESRFWIDPSNALVFIKAEAFIAV
jgi:hypothetical protein